MPVLRLQLPLDNTPRARWGNKDASFFNCFVDKVAAKAYVVKRPGTSSYITNTHAGEGIFVYNDILFYWDATHTGTSPNIRFL